ncbi:hypothetical protein B0T20DRAFT_404456 [Sordaria brevicollis]|uniref:VOC domain-containing protein n=1 Tax=Sordaria brevicollis TaxID=83679 RepID=A0AAE0PJ48_SORBR|nr:hypothetical protein B0T20DRAFT_404456 [Sordaria brevicollis]
MASRGFLMPRGGTGEVTPQCDSSTSNVKRQAVAGDLYSTSPPSPISNPATEIPFDFNSVFNFEITASQETTPTTSEMITGLHHVRQHPRPPSTLPLAHHFYSTTLSLTPIPVPSAQVGTLAWFNISDSGQQLHIAIGRPEIDFTEEARNASRHPCFKVENAEKLRELQERVWEHYKRGGEGAPMGCDEPGTVGSGAQGVEYPKRFFARDFAGNRLEFSL